MKALDGLRGVAALVVVAHHALMLFPSVAEAYYVDSAAESGFAEWLLTYTPLHIAWAGPEAVYLFFVLSGVVLVLPVVSAGRRFSWAGYYPRRMIRLYIPVAAAVALGLLLIVTVPRFQDPELGQWVSSRPLAYTWHAVAEDLTLIFGASGVISPLWSLRFEVLFSLLLPAYVLFAVAGRRYWAPKTAGLLILVIIGSLTGNAYLFLLPLFGLGSLIIVHWHELSTALSRASSRSRFMWPGFALGTVVLTTAPWVLRGVGAPATVAPFVDWLPAVGVAGAVILAGANPTASTVLSTRPIQWLGTISFSLYLVHEPIMLATRFLFFPLPVWLSLAVGVPLSFGAATLFTLLVEQPAHRVAKRVGTLSATLARRRLPGDT